MNNFIIALLLIVSALFSYKGYEQAKAQDEAYSIAMQVAAENYISKYGTFKKVTIQPDQVAVITYIQPNGAACAKHVVKLLSTPTPGMLGETCKFLTPEQMAK